MDPKTGSYFKSNERSLINSQFLINETVGVILVCAHDNSRSIYIESSNASTGRLIAKYSITFPSGSFASDCADDWNYTVLSNSKETAAEIRSLKKQSYTAEEYQVNQANIQRFTKSMDTMQQKELIPNGEQDDDIITALQEIGEHIEFRRNMSCAIS